MDGTKTATQLQSIFSIFFSIPVCLGSKRADPLLKGEVKTLQISD